MKYLVVYRGQDHPSMIWLNKTELKNFLVEHPSYRQLNGVPTEAFEEFPAESFVILEARVIPSGMNNYEFGW